MKTITARKLKETLDRNGNQTLVNVLPEKSFREKHIPGSINSPREEQGFVQDVERAAGGKSAPVVVYCGSKACDASPKAAQKLEQAGFTNVVDFEGGVAEWEQAGLPLEGSAVGTSHN